jgi:uncharacterized protein (TIGR03086 family)
MDLIDLYDRGSAWAGSKIPAAADKLDEKTPCDKWKVRDLLNHMVAVQDLFEGGATGASASPPAGPPPDVISDDPAAQYEEARQRVVAAYKQEGALEKGGQLLGIGFADQLMHGWDLAKATGQDVTMPEDLAQAAMQMLDGQLPPERRGDSFKPAVDVPDGASVQDRYVAYLGRTPN